jgi:hypothetical protein
MPPDSTAPSDQTNTGVAGTETQSQIGAANVDTTTATDTTTQAAPATDPAIPAPTTPPAEKAEGDTPEAAKEGEEGKEAEAEAPVEYAFSVPEGVTLDEEIGNELKEFAKERKMSPEDAQKLLDLGVKQRLKEAETFQKQRDEWRENIRTDKDIGGEKLEASLSLAKRVVDTFGTPGAQELLNNSWMGDHPELVKTFVAIGKAISEDTLVTSAGSISVDEKTIAQRMYPNMNP